MCVAWVVTKIRKYLLPNKLAAAVVTVVVVVVVVVAIVAVATAWNALTVHLGACGHVSDARCTLACVCAIGRVRFAVAARINRSDGFAEHATNDTVLHMWIVAY